MEAPDLGPACGVEEAGPGKKFVFCTLPARGVPDSTRWAYELETVDGGTRVTESYEIVDALPRWIQSSAVATLLPHHFDMRPHMARTLAAGQAWAGTRRRADDMRRLSRSVARA